MTTQPALATEPAVAYEPATDTGTQRIRQKMERVNWSGTVIL
ncbi:MAG: carbohydrate ABC transporter permease, partial [Comamonadaceae bacterium]